MSAPNTSGFDWRSIAARVALADGAFHGLTTPERDELEAAMLVEQKRRRPALWAVQDAAEHAVGETWRGYLDAAQSHECRPDAPAVVCPECRSQVCVICGGCIR